MTNNSRAKKISPIKPWTTGAHHIGLTVSRLEESARFFIDILGWDEVRRDPDYPAIFVSDGVLMITLWAVKSHNPVNFDKNENIGLHHLALRVKNFDALDDIYHRLTDNGIDIEFSPELLRDGPAKHMMCYEPSGIRIEFICIPS
jgi:catechol 2,3-dioxygenase-like lactoylglutathione lyase family enzyme